MSTMKAYSYGGCSYDRMSPQIEAIHPVLNIKITFTEALKLGLAIDECTRRLNKYKQSSKVGRQAGLNLIIHLGPKKIAVAETKV